MRSIILAVFFLICLSWTQQPTQPPQSRAAAGSPADLVKQGEKLNSEGKQDQALALYKKALKADPALYEAHLDSGIALDLKGNYAEAREHFAQALSLAPADSKQQALRATAMSYAFEGKADEAPSSSNRSSTNAWRRMISSLPVKRPTNSLASISNRATPDTPSTCTSSATTPLYASPTLPTRTKICGCSAGRTRKPASPPAAAKPTKPAST